MNLSDPIKAKLIDQMLGAVPAPPDRTFTVDDFMPIARLVLTPSGKLGLLLPTDAPDLFGVWSPGHSSFRVVKKGDLQLVA